MLSVLAVACTSSSEPQPAIDHAPTPTTLVATPSTIVILQLGSQQLGFAVLDENGDTIPGSVVTFAANPSQLLLVTPTGLVTSVGPAGAGVLVARSGSLTAQIPVTIIPVPTAIASLPASIALGQGGYFPLRAKVLDLVGNRIDGAVISFSASSPSVLEILPDNFVHSVGPLGSGNLVASYATPYGRVSDTASVRVDRYAVPTGTIIDTFPTGIATYGVAVSKSQAFFSGPNPDGPIRPLGLPALHLGSAVLSVGAGLGVAFDPSGNHAYVATLEDGLVVINSVANTVDSRIGYPMVGSQRDVTVSPDGQRLYVATTRTRVYVVNTATRLVVDSIAVPDLPNHFSWNPSGSRLYASLSLSGEVAEIDPSAGRVTRLFHTSSGTAQGTAVAPDGTELYNVTEGNELFVFDLASGNQLADVVGLGGFGLVASPDGSRLYVAGGPNVKIVDRLSRTLIDSLVVGGGAVRIALSPDGGTAFVANQAGWVNVIY